MSSKLFQIPTIVKQWSKRWTPFTLVPLGNWLLTIIGWKWLLTIKSPPNGIINYLKAHLVAKGSLNFMRWTIWTFFLEWTKLVRICHHISNYFSKILHQLDIKNLFLHGNLSKKVYMEQIPCLLLKAISLRLKQSPKHDQKHSGSLIIHFIS